MAIKPIVTSKEPKLRKPSVPVTTVTDAYLALEQDMQDSMVEKRGVGIAAPQIGVYEQVAIITQGSVRHGNRKSITIINPQIIESSEATETDDEGCLSIPGVFGPVERAYEVTVAYTDIHGKKKTLTAQGFNARVIQHEVDHLNGILFVDHISDPSLLHP